MRARAVVGQQGPDHRFAVAPALTEGRRIAYFLVDALHYELTAEFRQRLPDSLGAFRTGETFMHSGLSLPECIMPVLSVELGQPPVASHSSAQLQLQYRGGKTDRITTRRPMIELILFQQEMFSTPLSFRRRPPHPGQLRHPGTAH